MVEPDLPFDGPIEAVLLDHGGDLPLWIDEEDLGDAADLVVFADLAD